MDATQKTIGMLAKTTLSCGWITLNPWYPGLMYVLSCASLIANQNVLAPNLTAAAEDFGFTHKERDMYLGGYISLGLYGIGAPAAILVGWLSDRYSRRLLLLLVVVFGSIPSIATYWVTTYWELFLTRVLTGLSLGGSLPLFYSVLSDLYGPQHRLAACGMIQLALVLGTGAGQLAAGMIAPLSNWRLPFVVVPFPGLLIALITTLTTADPLRGSSDEVMQELYERHGFVYEEEVSWSELCENMKSPTYILTLLHSAIWMLPVASLMTFAPDYFNEEGGLSIEAASTIVLIFAVAMAAGAAIGGFGGQVLYNRWKPSAGLLTGGAVLLAAPPIMILLKGDISKVPTPVLGLLALLSGLAAGAPMATSVAMGLNVCEPVTRGATSGVQAMVANVLSGVGPYGVALLINVMGRTDAINLSVALWFPAGVLLLLTWRTIIPDEAKMEQRLAGKIAQLSALATPTLGDFGTAAALFTSEGSPHSSVKLGTSVNAPRSGGKDVDQQADSDDFEQQADGNDVEKQGNGDEFGKQADGSNGKEQVDEKDNGQQADGDDVEKQIDGR